MRLTDSGNATKQGVNEHWFAFVVQADIVNIKVPGSPAHLWQIASVKMLIVLAGLKGVFKTPQLIKIAQVKTIAVSTKPHYPIEGSVED